MSFFKADSSVTKTKMAWTANFPTSSITNRRALSRVESFNDYVRLPLKSQVLGRHHVLLEKSQKKKTRIQLIYDELFQLWKKFNFSTLIRQAITARLDKLISNYRNYQRKPSKTFEKDMQKVFDITNAGGEWLGQEEKVFFYRQIQSDGRVGYTTQKLAPASTIHPSKKRKMPKPNNFPSTSIQGAKNFSSESENESTSSISESTASEDTSDTEPASKRSSTSGATKMVIRHSMSTYKAAAVCSTLAEEGVILSTQSQSSVWRSVLRKGEKEKEKIKVILQQEKNYCLHFDGKKLSNSEYQVVCLQSQSREIKLGILKCSSGSAQHIYNQLEQILDEHIAWSCIKTIICDTTAVNTGRVNGVVVKLQKKMAEMGLERPQYI